VGYAGTGHRERREYREKETVGGGYLGGNAPKGWSF
jgi:hypothetical protein